MSVEPHVIGPASVTPVAVANQSRTIWPHIAFAALAVILVSSPLLFTDWTNAADFTNSFWYAFVRAWQVSHGQGASYYLQTYPTGLFYPLFAFYGGGLYAAAGLLALVIGNHPIAAFELLGVAAYTSAYGGTYWIGRQCGLSRVLAHVPALGVITSAYWSTVLYGRGDWAEFIAISSIPAVIASGTRILRDERLRFWPVLTFMVADFFFISSHVITLLWGTTLIIVFVGALFVTFRWRVRIARWGRLAFLFATGILTDAWSLGPIAAYSNDVQIAHNTGALEPARSWFFDPFSVVFFPFREVPAASTSPGLFVQASDWFLVWALVVIALFTLARRRWASQPAALIAAVIFGILIGFILTSSTVSLPSPWKNIQFPYRLNSYIALLTAAFVLIALLALQGAQRRAKLVGYSALGVAVIVSVVLCVWQLFVPVTEQPVPPGGQGSLTTRAEALTPPTDPPVSFESFDDYADALDTTIISASSRYYFPLSALSANNQSLSELAALPAGTGPIDTNISGGPEFITISGGVHRVGDDPDGRAVIERNVPGSGPVTVTISSNHSWMSFLPYVSGVGVVATLGLLGMLSVSDAKAWRRRRAGLPDGEAEDEVTAPTT